MAFGNAVTELSQIGIGTVGYIVRADTTSLLSYGITGVQAQATASNTPSPAMPEVTLEILLGYLNDISAPDLAFNYGYGEVTIFFKTSVFPYVATTRFILIGRRNPLKLVDPSDKLDIKDSDMELFVNYVIKFAALMSGQPVPYNIEKTIHDKETEIKYANSTVL